MKFFKFFPVFNLDKISPPPQGGNGQNIHTYPRKKVIVKSIVCLTNTAILSEPANAELILVVWLDEELEVLDDLEMVVVGGHLEQARAKLAQLYSD